MSATSVRRIVTDERVARYVALKTGSPSFPPYTVMGIEQNGEIVAGVLFNNMADRDIEVTVAGERGAFTRDFLRAVGQYVFSALDRSRISITTRHDKVLDIARRLGAQMEGVRRDRYGPGLDAMMLGITKANWKIR